MTVYHKINSLYKRDILTDEYSCPTRPIITKLKTTDFSR